MGSRVTRQLNERWIHWGLLNAKSPCLVQESSEPQIAACSIDILGTSCTCYVPKFFSRDLLLITVKRWDTGLCWYSLTWCFCFYVFKDFCELFHISSQENLEEEKDQMITHKGMWIEVTKRKIKRGKFQILSFLYAFSHSPSITYLWCEDKPLLDVFCVTWWILEEWRGCWKFWSTSSPNSLPQSQKKTMWSVSCSPHIPSAAKCVI